MSGKLNKSVTGRGASTRSDAAAAEQYVSRLSLGKEALPPFPSLLPLAIRHSFRYHDASLLLRCPHASGLTPMPTVQNDVCRRDDRARDDVCHARDDTCGRCRSFGTNSTVRRCRTRDDVRRRRLQLW